METTRLRYEFGQEENNLFVNLKIHILTRARDNSAPASVIFPRIGG